MKQYALAFHNYHDTNNVFPPGIGKISKSGHASQMRFNAHCRILPFIEQTPLFEAIAASSELPWSTLVSKPITTFICPSDDYARMPGSISSRTSIVICIGDSGVQALRGIVAWTPQNITVTSTVLLRSFDSINDGSSNTCLCSEIVSNLASGDKRLKGGVCFVGGNIGSETTTIIPSYCMNNAISTTDRSQLTSATNGVWRGWRVFDANTSFSGFNTILPPNSPACVRDNNDASWGLYPPQSNHNGGVNCGVVDGSVRFIRNSIDTGGLNNSAFNNTGISAFGVWGAFGTVNGNESKSVD
jgi:hypothetical protein